MSRAIIYDKNIPFETYANLNKNKSIQKKEINILKKKKQKIKKNDNYLSDSCSILDYK